MINPTHTRRHKLNLHYCCKKQYHNLMQIYDAMLTGSVTRNFQIWRYFRRPVWKTKIKSKPTRTLKHTDSYSRVFWTFLPNVIKIDPYILSYTVSKLARFFETQCILWHSLYRLVEANWLDCEKLLCTNEVSLRWARLIHGWVIIYGQVNHPRM